MKSIFRLAPQLRQVASTSKLPQAAVAAPSYLAGPSSSQRRHLQTTQALDPKDEATTASSASAIDSAAADELFQAASQGGNDDLAQRFAESQGSFSDSGSHQVHVPLSYLHPSTIPSEPSSSYVPLSAHVFGTKPRRDIIHSAIVYHLDSLRSGTASTKTRSEVNYGGRKLRPQKGTGNARLGTRGNPLLKGGGVAHGPKPRDFATELPRRVREMALRSALSARWQEGKLHVVPDLFWDPPPGVTGPLRKTLREKSWEDVLFLTAPREHRAAQKMGIRQRVGRPSALDPVYTPEQVHKHGNFVRDFAVALANIPNTEMIRLELLTEEAREEAKTPEDKRRPGELAAYEVIRRQNTVLDLGAVEWLEEKLGGSIFHEHEFETLVEKDEEELKEMKLEGVEDVAPAMADAPKSAAL